jgi:hypothetical protein
LTAPGVGTIDAGGLCERHLLHRQRRFLGNNVREQKPLYGIQGHAIYNFNPSLWAALDATYYTAAAPR